MDGGNPVPGERAKDGLIFLRNCVAPKWVRVHRVPVASETATKNERRDMNITSIKPCNENCTLEIAMDDGTFLRVGILGREYRKSVCSPCYWESWKIGAELAREAKQIMHRYGIVNELEAVQHILNYGSLKNQVADAAENLRRLND